MRTLFSINHPSQYHMFKHLAKKLLADDNKVIFFIQTRGIIEELIQADWHSKISIPSSKVF